MSQSEVYQVIKDKPRISTKEIAEILGLKTKDVSEVISKMLNKEIMSDSPTEKEYKLLLKRYPTIKHAPKSNKFPNSIKLFEVINDE